MTGEATAHPDIDPDRRDDAKFQRYTDPEGNEQFVAVFQKRGTKLSMAELTAYFQDNPAIQDSDAALVRVKSPDPNDTALYDIFLDGYTAVAPESPDGPRDLRQPGALDAVHDIEVGQPWESPFGLSGEVLGVVIPSMHDPDPSQVTREHPGTVMSPTAHGRNVIDQAIGR